MTLPTDRWQRETYYLKGDSMTYLEQTSDTLRAAALKSNSPLFSHTYKWLADVVDSTTSSRKAVATIRESLPRSKRNEMVVIGVARSIAKQIERGESVVCL